MFVLAPTSGGSSEWIDVAVIAIYAVLTFIGSAGFTNYNIMARKKCGNVALSRPYYFITFETSSVLQYLQFV